MRCRDVEKLCTSYVDGEVDERVASALRGHLRTCSACRTLVEDEAAIRDAAAGLEPIEPPSELWNAVEARLAEAEIADAERSRAWLWWQGLRQHALPAAVAVAAIVVALVWSSRRNGGGETAQQPDPDRGRAAELAVAESPEDRAGALPTESFLEVREREVLATDSTYLNAIAELDAVVKVERENWSPNASRSFDARLDDLEGAARRYARDIAVDRRQDPESRDMLYTAYSAQIGHMQRTVLAEMFE